MKLEQIWLKAMEEQAEVGAIETADVKPGVKSGNASALPSLRPWERSFEVICTLTTGLIFIAKLLNPLSIFIASCAFVWIAWAIFQFYRHGSGILSLWGLRIDQPNLKHSFILPSLFAVVALVAIPIGTAVQKHMVSLDNWHLWLILALYPFYGVLQHAAQCEIQ